MTNQVTKTMRRLVLTVVCGMLAWSALVWWGTPYARGLWTSGFGSDPLSSSSVPSPVRPSSPGQSSFSAPSSASPSASDTRVADTDGDQLATVGAKDSSGDGDGDGDRDDSASPQSPADGAALPLGHHRSQRLAVFQELLKRIVKARVEIVQRWGHDDSQFARSMPVQGNEAVLAAKFAAALVSRREFVVGCVGSSNSAGHDNKFSDAYPSRVADALNKLLEPAGAPVRLRNHAVGNTWTMPQAFCLRDIIGEPLDILYWEYGMNDAGNPQYELDWYETWIRNALRLQGQPVPHFVMIEGGRRLEDNHGKPFQPRDPSHWPNSFNSNQNSRQLREYYKEFNVHWMYQLDALAPYDHEEQYAYKTLFVTFHPGPAGHQHLADQLVFYYLRALEMATEMLVGALRNADMSDHDIVSAYGRVPEKPLPPQKWCEARVCGSTEPECRTAFEPRVGPGLHETAVDPGQWQWREVPNQVHHPEKGIVDVKYCFAGTKESGELQLTVNCEREGIIVVCEAPAEWSRPDGWGSLANDAVFTVDGEPPPPDGKGGDTRPLTRIFHTPKMMNSCVQVTQIASRGQHTIGISVKSESSNTLYVSQIISL